ncbi:hypothetical protein CWATWH0402_5968 [Crocosphaera watsonii WH 0402]|uniref:Uncharacterized protein n=1 Tax=Crocosphaera watsonii WH 0402 TaxID=1284629 RepID=T2JN41_CROWT|nr:hypothetical protein CWATWH0402_5968 [Crocosphaera watsonii WH 0402]
MTKLNPEISSIASTFSTTCTGKGSFVTQGVPCCLSFDTPLPKGEWILGSLIQLTLTGIATNQNRGRISPSV